MKVKNVKELLTENLLVKHRAGSHAYGTNISSSDEDYRGIFAADPINVRTPFFIVREIEDSIEEDTKYYELAHFMKLCIDCNPNIIESLWCADSDILFRTPAYDKLRNHRYQLLSSKVAFTTSGYALSQLKRIKGHNKWINCPQPEQPPVPYQFVSLVQWFGKEKMLPRDFDLKQFKVGYMLVPYGGNIFGLYPRSGASSITAQGDLNDYPDEDKETLDTPLAVIKWNVEVYRAAKEKHEQYWTWKENRNKIRSELEEEYGYDCYTDDTEFLTSTGWKRFDDVLESDKLATFNEITHKIEYQSPTEKIDSKFSGNLYHLTGYHVDTLVTSNHNMFVRPYSRTNKHQGEWGYYRAAELPETFDTLNVIIPKKNRQLLPSNFNIKILEEIDILNYLRLMGWYISDGTMSFDKNGKPKHLIISQSKPQSKLTQTLTKQINYGKIKCNHYTFEPQGIANNPERRWIFNNPVASLLYNDCGHKSESKRLPSWVFSLTKREMSTLLIALLQGDGTKKDYQHHTYVYYTINKNLADDVQRLAFLCGFETSMYGPYAFESQFGNNIMFHVHVNMRPRLYRRHVRSSSVEKIPVVDKRIVCFMVPNYTLVTRRNGQIGLHGNTKHAMHLVRLLRMGVEALRDGEIIVKRPDAAELLDIRNGKWTYDELVQYAEQIDNEIHQVWYKKTALPRTVDRFFAAKLLMEIQDIVWNK